MDTPLGLASPSRLNLKSPFTNSPSSILKPKLGTAKHMSSARDDDEDFDPFLPRPKVQNTNSPAKRSPTKTSVKVPLRDNEGLTRFMNVNARDEDTMNLDLDMDVNINVNRTSPEGDIDADDSGFSAFSTIAFSPTKHFGLETQTQTQTPRRERTEAVETPGTVRQRPSKEKEKEETTLQLLEFTEQFDAIPARTNGHASPTRTRDVFATPMTRPTTATQRQGNTYGFGNLLDFDMPPPLTPGSRPSISVKEVEKLKAEHKLELEQIQKEAALQRRELESALQDSRKEKDELSKRFEEMKTVNEREFQTLQSAYINLQKESQRQMQVLRDLLTSKDSEMTELKTQIKESESKREEAESRADTLDSKLAGYEAEHAASSAPGDVSTPGSGANKALNAAVEKVARELHALYKGKHGTKVEALKKSYESRYQKQMKEMQGRIDELTRELEGAAPRETDRSAKVEATDGGEKISELEKTVAKNEDRIADLEDQLTRSREENSELVAAVDEMLSLQTQTQTQSTLADAGTAETRSPVRPRPALASGLRGPGGIPAPSGLKKPASMTTSGPARSGIMSNIERMGRGRAVPSSSSSVSG